MFAISALEFYMRCAAVCSSRQFDDGVLIFLLNKASGS